MNLYASVVFVHVTTVMLFFIAHGTSMAVAFALKRETDPARVRALLDLSRFSLGAPAIFVIVVGLLTGILAGFMGNHWGRLWIWVSLVVFLAVAGAMTPLASLRLNPIRAAAGMAPANKKDAVPPVEDAEELRRLIDAWRPLPIAAMGLTAFVVILWLMLLKPF